ncbi:DinB/UmuC family translesion DNA polymerase [Dysgonomonas capnocytophagoides]|uniref:DinB/UmuC family translesion DNA polymerase n=1 Tax=Dysgonomonas capnocytophagoides TaxID=45254 RepID=UPI0029213569|nr:hypothetical protein DCPSUM001_20670 [Dysgonomonas capnocytophagoides]
MQKTEIGDVWGIGRRISKTLEYYGVNTVYNLNQKSRSWVRSKMTVVGERTWLKLQGEPCITSDSVVEKQQMCTSRSFRQPITEYNNLLESIASLASLSIAKLKKQKTVTKSVYIFVQTDRFDENVYQTVKGCSFVFLYIRYR